MYNVYDAFAIKDDIKRSVYLHSNFYTDDAGEIDRRISEYIELHDNKTIVESSEDYTQALVTILVILCKVKDRIRNYNFLFYTTMIAFCGYADTDVAFNTIKDFEKDDYQIWIRRKKLVTLSNKLKIM